MQKFIFILFLLATANTLQSQNCNNLNFPAALADSCDKAPFLCGNYLDNYCGTNTGLTDDAFGLSSGFLELAPCEDFISLQISVFDCSPSNTGLLFSLYPDGCDPLTVLGTDTIFSGQTDTFLVQNLDALEHYGLVISGLQGSQCSFTIQVLDGIGTALPGPSTCTCTDGSIDGPSHICNTGPVAYSVSNPNCFISIGAPVGGNGEYCPPSDACPSTLDSLVLNWNIPDIMHFVGDSTGNSVVIQLDSSYMGLDTIRLDTIWVSWELVSTQPMDTLNFCSCAGVSCSGGILPFPITIGRKKYEFFCELTCTSPTCTVEGVVYDSPGTYTYDSIDCVLVLVHITQQFEEPIVPSKVICLGEFTTLSVLNANPDFTYVWSTGEIGPSILVSPLISSVYTVTATHFTGDCVFFATGFVSVDIPQTTDYGEVGIITCAEPCIIFQGQTYCQPGNYVVPVGQCDTSVFSIGFDPALFIETLPVVTLCEGECYVFYGQQICVSMTATHTESCTTYVQQVIIGPQFQNDLGIVGSINCTDPCFTFEGVTYCNSGEYTVPDGLCGSKKFTITFEKEIIALGEVGMISCTQNCVTYNNATYCQPGLYSISDSCTRWDFIILADTVLPVVSTPFLDCLPNNTHFTLAFTLSGRPPFKVNGVALTDSVFISPPLVNGTEYAYVVEHANGCQTVVSGTYDCASFCNSDAGRLSGDIQYGCADTMGIAIQSIEPPVEAPGDVLLYQLFTDDGMEVAQNETGIFVFDPTLMMVGETYYAVRIVGEPDINGVPNLANLCTDTSNAQPIVFRSVPDVQIMGDSSFCEDNLLLLTASGAETYLWSTGTVGETYEIAMAGPDDAGLYEVLGTDEYGCSDADTVLVTIKPKEMMGCCVPLMPNAFTPNGDGANDSFVPILPDCNPLEYAEMRVYSRWGQLVFRGAENQIRWDGRMPDGEPATSDTYVFTFRYRLRGDTEKTEKGEITLLR